MEHVYEILDTFNYPHWHKQGLCRDPQYDPNWWQPTTPKNRNLAIAVCKECPVRTKCLEWILSIEQAEQRTSAGIYGGYTDKQRKRMKWCYLKGCKKRPTSTRFNFCSEEHKKIHTLLNHQKYNARKR